MLLAKAEETQTINLGYDIDAFKWGKTVDEVFADKGVVLNAFDEATQTEIEENDHLGVFYTTFSS
mgnify:CR=1 FL=1